MITEAVKERPILFNGAMVRAILDGSKTQMRRVITPQPEQRADGWHVKTKPRSGYSSESLMRDLLPVYSPYGNPGDRLWVRETWGVAGEFRDGPAIAYRATDDRNGITWKPSIHMPRALSRITLEVQRVRVERVQDITPEDAYAEGISQVYYEHAVGAFRGLWDSINAKRGYGWDVNCWVWVVEFTRVEA